MSVGDGRDGAMMRIDLHGADVLNPLQAQAARVFLSLPGLPPALPQSGAPRIASHEDDIALPSERPCLENCDATPSQGNSDDEADNDRRVTPKSRLMVSDGERTSPPRQGSSNDTGTGPVSIPTGAILGTRQTQKFRRHLRSDWIEGRRMISETYLPASYCRSDSTAGRIDFPVCRLARSSVTDANSRSH
jgi:hypothetical protein